MLESTHDFWSYYEEPTVDALCCTTNMVVKRDGSLTMGAGIAKHFANSFPDLPKEWGTRTKKIHEGILKSNILATFHVNGKYLISFPTKYHWREKSDISLIRRSAIQLYTVTQAMGWQCVVLPQPGCANGGLTWEDVKPVLEPILDNRFIIVIRN